MLTDMLVTQISKVGSKGFKVVLLSLVILVQMLTIGIKLLL